MKLKGNLDTETIGRLPLREPVVVEKSTPLGAAVCAMRTRSLGCAVIVDTDRKPLGFFTERSLLDALMQDAPLETSQVGDFHDAGYVEFQQDEPIRAVWDSVEQEGSRFICVVDEAGRLVGLTGQRGLAEYVSEHFPRQVMAQRLGNKPWLEHREGS